MRRCATSAALLLCWSSGAAAQSMVAHLDPPANALGWNNTGLTIRFQCVDVSPCPPAVAITEEGGTLRVSRLSFSSSGRVIEQTAIVNVDLTPPAVRIGRPSKGERTSDESVVITATALDHLSGLANATCNGRPASLTGASISCDVALREGENDLIVSVTDRAGNQTSAATRVLRVSATPVPHVEPSSIALLVGQAAALQILDAAAQPHQAGTITSSDSGIVEVADTARGVIVGRRAGTARVTVATDGNVDTVEVSVFAGAFPLGTMIWEASMPLPGFRPGRLLQPEIVAGGADSLWVEVSDDAGAMIRATGGTSPPRLLWIEWPAVASDELLVERMVDESGGGLLLLQRRNGSGSAIVRIGHPIQGVLWRYESNGRLQSNFAMGWDNTLYIVETPAHGFPQVVGLDGETGATKWRVPVPRTTPDNDDDCAATRALPPLVGPPTIPDGIAAAVAFVTDRGCSSTLDKHLATVGVLRIWPDGTSATTRLAFARAAAAADVTLFKVVPDGHGALLVPLRAASPPGFVHRVIRMLGTRLQQYQLPTYGEYVLGEDWAYTTDGHTLVAFDPVTGRVAWTRRFPTGIKFQFSTAGGGVAIETEETLRLVDTAGKVGPPLGLAMHDLQQVRRR